MFAMMQNEIRIADVDEFTGKILISLTAYFADRRHPDMDNIAKLVADALEGLCYRNDRQVAWGRIDYTIGDPGPRLELEITWGDQLIAEVGEGEDQDRRTGD